MKFHVIPIGLKHIIPGCHLLVIVCGTWLKFMAQPLHHLLMRHGFLGGAKLEWVEPLGAHGQ